MLSQRLKLRSVITLPWRHPRAQLRGCPLHVAVSGCLCSGLQAGVAVLCPEDVSRGARVSPGRQLLPPEPATEDRTDTECGPPLPCGWRVTRGTARGRRRAGAGPPWRLQRRGFLLEDRACWSSYLTHRCSSASLALNSSFLRSRTAGRSKVTVSQLDNYR